MNLLWDSTNTQEQTNQASQSEIQGIAYALSFAEISLRIFFCQKFVRNFKLNYLCVHPFRQAAALQAVLVSGEIYAASPLLQPGV